jgi:hypothetical protein
MKVNPSAPQINLNFMKAIFITRQEKLRRILELGTITYSRPYDLFKYRTFLGKDKTQRTLNHSDSNFRRLVSHVYKILRSKGKIA